MIKQYLYNKRNLRNSLSRTDKAFKLLDNRLNVIRKFPSRPAFEFTADKVVVRQMYYQIGRKLYWKSLPRSYKKRIGRWNKEMILKYKFNFIKKWKKNNTFFRWRRIPIMLKLISQRYFNNLPKKLRNSLSILINNKVELRIIRLVSPLLDSYMLAKLFASNSYFKNFRRIFNKVKKKIRIYDSNKNPDDYFSKLDLKLFYNSKYINQILSLRSLEPKDRFEYIKNSFIYILLNLNNIILYNNTNNNVVINNKFELKDFFKWISIENLLYKIINQNAFFIINIFINIPFNNIKINLDSIVNKYNKKTNNDNNIKIWKNGINVFVSKYNIIKLDSLINFIIKFNHFLMLLLNSFEPKKKIFPSTVLNLINNENMSYNNPIFINRVKVLNSKMKNNLNNLSNRYIENNKNVIKLLSKLDHFWLNNGTFKQIWINGFSNILFIQNYLSKYINIKYKNFFNLLFVRFNVYKAIYTFSIFNKLTKYNINSLFLTDLNNFIYKFDRHKYFDVFKYKNFSPNVFINNNFNNYINILNNNNKCDINNLDHPYTFNLVNYQSLQKLGWVKFLNKSSFFDFSIDINSYIYKKGYINIFYNHNADNCLVDKQNNNLRTVFTHFFLNRKQNLKSYIVQDSLIENNNLSSNLNYNSINHNNLNYINNLDENDNNISNLLLLKDKFNLLHNKQYLNNISNKQNINLDIEQNTSDTTQINNNSIINSFKEYIPYTLILGLAVILSGKMKKKNPRKTVHKRITGSFSKVYHTQTSKYTARNKVGSFTMKVSICQTFLDSPRKQFTVNNTNPILSIYNIRMINLLKLNNSYASSHTPLNNNNNSIPKKPLSKNLFSSPKYATFKNNYYKR